MRLLRRSPLFSAVVVAGASLTRAIGGCGGGPAETEADASVASSSEAGGPDAGDDGQSSFTPTDADAVVDDASCPDGSDRPVPPCMLIR